MRILMTGTTGFLANAFLQRHGEHYAVTCLGRAPHPLAKAFAECDLANPASLRDALQRLSRGDRFDAVVHLAVSRRHREFPLAAADLFQVNTAATVALLDFARATGVSHFCLGSTGSVYDTPVGHRMSEDDLTSPKSFFAGTKLAADMLAACYRPLLAVSILRFFVPYGPGLEQRMLNQIYDSVRLGRPIKVPPSGPPLTFAPIYGGDAADVVVTCLREAWNETVNVASEETVTIVDAARIMGSILKMEATTEADPSAGSHFLVPDLARLRARVDIGKFVPFKIGVERMLRSVARPLDKHAARASR